MANCIQCGRTLPGFSFGKRLCQWCIQHQAMQRGDLPEDAKQPVIVAPWVRHQNAPLVTHAIFGINVAVFLGMVLAGVSFMEPAPAQLVHWGANFGPLTLSGQWWRLLTCVFVHAGIIHIGLNMWCLWYLGEMAESLYGHVMYAVVYLVCGVGASVVSLAWHQNSPSVGASGAIFGIAGALIASLKLGNFSLPSGHVRSLLSSVLTFAGYNLVFGAFMGRTDNAAHVGGLVTGLILGALIAIAAPGRGQYVRRATVLVLVSCLVAGGAAWTYRSKAYFAHLQRAFELNVGGNKDAAIAELQTALRLRPDYVPARLYLAATYEGASRYGEAEAELKKGLILDPGNEVLRNRLGYLYVWSKQTAKAREYFQQMLSIDPKDAEAHFGIATVLTLEGNDPAAIEEYKTAATLDPKLEDVQYKLGLIYTRLGRFDDAIEAFRREIQVSGDSPESEEGLANAYQTKGLPKEAEDARAKAAKLKADYEKGREDATP